MMRNEKKRLYVSIEQLSRQTEWAGWFKEVLLTAAQVSLYRIETWEPFKSLSDNTMAVRWLTKQIRLCNPLPPEKPQQEVVFYILAAYCSDNQVLGYMIDTFRYYYRSKNNQGVLSCIRILYMVNQHDEYPHLNVLYKLAMGCMLRDYRLYVTPRSQHRADSFMTDMDFRVVEKYLPDFKPIGFKERLQAVQHTITSVTTSEELARLCCMSGSVFRKRFKQEFDIPVSEWLRQRRKERIEHMLRNVNSPLYQVAENNGFNMPSTFSDYCRRNFGESPKLLRKKLTEL